ncbi:4240_t:CDS:1, partial [Cetraspora pellucida]
FRNLELLAIYPGENARRQHLEKLQAHRRLKDVQFYFCNIDDDLKGYYQDQSRRNRGSLYTKFVPGSFFTTGSE